MTPFAFLVYNTIKNKIMIIMKPTFFKTVCTAVLTVAAVQTQAQLLKGTVVAKEMPDMAINYTVDGDMLNMTSLELTADKDGTFTYDAKLPVQVLDASLYVGNDIFGVRLERGKQAIINIKADESGQHYTAEIDGDNAKASRFYNTYVQAFDIMKYFSPDPSETKSCDEYRRILEDEYVKVLKALPTVKDKVLREYYTHLSAGMYTWTKIRIIMDQAETEKKQFNQYPEYNELVSTIDPNDTINLRTNLVFAWLTAEMGMNFHGNETDKYIKGMDIVDAKITNPTVKTAMVRYMPYAYFSYGGADGDSATRFFERFQVFAKDYSQLIEQYGVKLDALNKVKTGGEVPYDPEMTRPDGTTCHLADLKGKVVYIDVWATWCGPCCKEIPHLEKLVERFKYNDNVRFISISIDENRDAWQKKLDKDKPQWEQFILSTEEQERFMSNWGIGGIPRFIILDAEGRLINADAARPSNPALVEELEKVKR